MGKKTIIFNQLIEAIDRRKFSDLVKKHESDHYIKCFDSWSHCLTLFYTQLNNQESLRGIEMNFGHSICKEKITNVAIPKRSTLSDANRRRPAEFFQDVCMMLIEQLQSMHKRKKELNEALQLIDSTPIQLCGRGMEWVEKTQRIKGLKAHFIYDTEEDTPIYFSITSAKVNDIVEAQKINLEPNQILVFDRAYYDFAWWNQITQVGSSFITRPKSTLTYKTIEKLATRNKDIICDHLIKLTSKKGYKYKEFLRLITAKVEIRGKVRRIKILTNNLKLSAAKIVTFYKKRWDIELFFKWIKQNLKIKKFFSQNENAIKVQIITAIMTYVLIRILQIRSKSDVSLRRLILFLKSHLFSKIKIKNNNKSDKISLPRILVGTQRGYI